MLDVEIETFKGFLEIEQRSPHTIRQYLDILKWFEEFFIEENINFESFSEKDVVKFQLWLKKKTAQKQFLKEKGYEPSEKELTEYMKIFTLNGKSVYKYITAIKKFLEVNDKQLNWTKIPSPKYDDNFNPDVLTKEQIEKIAYLGSNYCSFHHKTVTENFCSKCSKYREPRTYKASVQRTYPEVCFYFDGLKLKVMILLAYEAALRTDELCNLKLKHLNLKKKEIFIEKPLKHSQPQAIPISNNLTSLLKDYLDQYKYLKEDEDLLFPTKTGKKYHPNNFATHVFRPIAQEAGFDVRYYTLRHSRATNLIKQGLDIGWVRRITRHRNINNVLKYIHLDSEDIRKELERKEII
ncbi:MAG: tyrosine-type recombinase/integrase [Candidatus Thorarchaeota archaeon]